VFSICHLHVYVCVQLAAITQVQRYIAAIDVMQRDVQLPSYHGQRVAVYAGDDAAPKVGNSSSAAIRCLAATAAAAASSSSSSAAGTEVISTMSASVYEAQPQAMTGDAVHCPASASCWAAYTVYSWPQNTCYTS
jgi:biotin carboxyl carrier protein